MTETTEKKYPIVTVGYAYTVNLGDFENVKVHVEVTDVPRGSEKAGDLYDRLDKFVSDRVNHEVAVAKAAKVN